MLGSSRNWQTAGADLAAHFHVFALDLRNHGRSPHDAVMTYEAMMEDVLVWMDMNSLRRVSLMGHSMGGKVAMLLACRQPERVERLFVVDIVAKDYFSSAHRVEFAAMNELDLRTLLSRGEAEMKFEGRVWDWAMRKFLTTNLERDPEAGGAWKWLINLPVLTAALPVLEKNSLAEGERYEGPVTVIAGGKSRYLAEGDVERMKVFFPAVTVAVIADAGHNPHMETREEFVRAVGDALAE